MVWLLIINSHVKVQIESEFVNNLLSERLDAWSERGRVFSYGIVRKHPMRMRWVTREYEYVEKNSHMRT